MGKPESARWAVPLLIPVSAVISRQERPCARSVAILVAVGNIRAERAGAKLVAVLVAVGFDVRCVAVRAHALGQPLGDRINTGLL